MESSEEAPAEAEKAAKPIAPRRKYKKRKHDPVETRRIERVRKLKVACMSETELTNYLPGLKEKKNKKIKKRKCVIPKSKYRSHYVKKTVKNTYKTLPRSPDERAEVLSKLAEQALMKLEAQASASKSNLLAQEIKREVLESDSFEIQE